MSIEYRQFPKKMKQDGQPLNNITNSQQFPKMPPIQGITVQNFPSTHSKPFKKQPGSPIRIKQFLKLFKHSDSNTRILKVSPYCNTILKNKIINALHTTNTKRNQRNQKYYYPIKKTEKTNGTYEKSNGDGDNCVVSNFQGHSYSQDVSIGRLGKKGDAREGKGRVEGFLRGLSIQIEDEIVELDVSDDIVDENLCLSVGKIIQAVQNNYRGIRYSNKIYSIVGFSVIGFQNKKRQRSNDKPRKSIQHQQKPFNPKNFLQSSSYLLSIGKLSIQNPKFQKLESLTLRPTYPKRIKQFLTWKQQQQKQSQRNSQNEHNNISQVNKPMSIFKNKEQKYVMKNINICDFDIVKCLGSGGFSTVFLVRGNFNGKYYAMKVIDKKFIMETQRDGIVENQRFILENLSKKQDKERKGINFITELSFSFETSFHFIFVLEYCPGGELFNQLKKVRKMTQEQAKFYFLQILIAIDYIHSHNVIYRDLKPQNLLIDCDGHIKIADFGLSKPLQNFKAPSYSFCGSPEYMAPEMLTKSGHNHLLDYYCLGALLYQLVIGVPPYYSLKQQQIYQSILTQDLSFPKHISLSPQIMNLLSGLLKKDPKQRLGSLCGIKQIMCHPWFGRISRATIQNKQLKPPFVPDLNQNNFDAEEIKANVGQIMEKLRKDARDRDFQTHFSDEFMFINSKERLQFLQKYSKDSNTHKLFAKTSRRSHLPKSNSVPHTNRLVSNYAGRSLLRQKQYSKHSTLRNENKIDQIDQKTKRKMKSQKSNSRRKKIMVKKNIDKQNWQ